MAVLSEQAYFSARTSSGAELWPNIASENRLSAWYAKDYYLVAWFGRSSIDLASDVSSKWLFV
jgi:hypothetical protein